MTGAGVVGLRGGSLSPSCTTSEPGKHWMPIFFIAFIASNLGILIQWPQVSRTPNLPTDAPLLSRPCVCVLCMLGLRPGTSGALVVWPLSQKVLSAAYSVLPKIPSHTNSAHFLMLADI